VGGPRIKARVILRHKTGEIVCDAEKNNFFKNDRSQRTGKKTKKKKKNTKKRTKKTKKRTKKEKEK
jgi:hypothetical protein